MQSNWPGHMDIPADVQTLTMCSVPSSIWHVRNTPQAWIRLYPSMMVSYCGRHGCWPNMVAHHPWWAVQSRVLIVKETCLNDQHLAKTQELVGVHHLWWAAESWVLITKETCSNDWHPAKTQELRCWMIPEHYWWWVQRAVWMMESEDLECHCSNSGESATPWEVAVAYALVFCFDFKSDEPMFVLPPSELASASPTAFFKYSSFNTQAFWILFITHDFL